MRLLLLSLLLAATTTVTTQAKSVRSFGNAFLKDSTGTQADTAKKAKKATLKANIGFMSNTVFLGRTDSVATTSYSAGLTYTLKSGIFFSGSVNYIPSRQFDKVDEGTLEAGYNFDHDDLSGGFTVSKYFASFNSTQLISALNANLSAELSYNLFDVISPSVHVDYALNRSGSNNDFVLNAGLDHEFEFEKLFDPHDHLGITPAFHLNAGTQNFYTTYIVRKKAGAGKRFLHASASAKGKGKGISTGVTATTGKGSTTTQTTSTNKFQTLDYEWSAALEYSIKKFTFELTPTYAIAVNQVYDDGTKTVSQPNSSVFYFQASLSYTF